MAGSRTWRSRDRSLRARGARCLRRRLGRRRSARRRAPVLRRNPLAPAWSAWNRYSSRSKVVRMSTCAPGSAATIRRVASIPSMPGIRTSMSTTSGRRQRTSSTAPAPSAASPTTSISASLSSIIRNPERTIAWSSAITTRIIERSSPGTACHQTAARLPRETHRSPSPPHGRTHRTRPPALACPRAPSRNPASPPQRDQPRSRPRSVVPILPRRRERGLGPNRRGRARCGSPLRRSGTPPESRVDARRNLWGHHQANGAASPSV